MYYKEGKTKFFQSIILLNSFRTLYIISSFLLVEKIFPLIYIYNIINIIYNICFDTKIS